MIDIRSVDIVYLHGPHRPERKEHIQKVLDKHGLSGECHTGYSEHGKKSGVMGMIDIMKKRLENFTPFILIEDDCNTTEWFRYEIPVPENSDALFLGISRYGIHPHHDYGIPQVAFSEVPNEPDIVRVYNMLSNHAIFFISRRWTENCLKCFEKVLSESNKPNEYDIQQARTMYQYNVYALRNPLFYQDETIGGQQWATYVMFPSEVKV